MLESGYNIIRNRVMYGGRTMHTDPCLTCVIHGLSLMSIGIIIGKKIVLSKTEEYFKVARGWLNSGCK